MNNFKSGYMTLLGAMLYTLTAGQPVLADDTEVLVGTGGVSWATPNVLFIMDTSGSMARDVDGNLPPAAGQDSKLTIVKNVFDNLINDSAYLGLNIGLMRFDQGGTGGYFVTPMQILSTSTRSDFVTAANNFTAQGNTPLAETLYEAARFYRGMSVDFGDDTTPGVNDPAVVDGANYISPINSQCQKNYIILLTDGEPNSDNEADNSIAAMTGSTCSGNCLDDLAGFLHTTDQNGNANDGDQTVETYTIGFTTDQTLLENTAANGGGDYIIAGNQDELATAFGSILNTIVGTNDTFSPPAMAANAFNSISHYNKLYFTLYEPTTAPKWDGNVKPYQLNDAGKYIDADGLEAVSSVDGTFLDDSRSFWSTSDDGSSVATGGANGRLPTAASRKLYTFTGDYDAATGALSSEVNLSSAGNALKSSGSDLTYSMLGLADDTNFASIISTIRSSSLGDPLHSKPALINYGGTADDPDLTLYVATNAGFLHALDASTDPSNTNSGRETFAFIPKELLTNLPALANNTGSHLYGLDGDVTAWVNDINKDGDISDTVDGVDEFAYVYVGMRRGGNNYYALDVTNRNAPKLKWVIKGGPDGMADFAELGQTWSRPSVTTIKYGSGTKTVLIFGGGYDTAQDDNPVNQADDIGHAIYIVDADTGQRLWWASSTDGADLQIASMTNSIPSDVRLFDSDLDGNTDRLYVGDMDGKIFRIDLAATDSGMTGSGILFADLGSTNNTDAANNRRFYYPPDVVLTRQAGKAPYISINIGSGYRSHPLNPVDPTVTLVNDRFYSLRDPFVIGEPVDFTTITHTSTPALYDATTNLVDTQNDINALNSSSGWFITLGRGEKVLAPSVTLNGTIFFTSYTPSDNSENTSCAPLPGLAQLYSVSLFDSSPVLTDTPVDGNGDPIPPSAEDRSSELNRRGIPPEPTVMFRENDSGDVDIFRCVGTDCEKMPNAIKMEETYWRDDA